MMRISENVNLFNGDLSCTKEIIILSNKENT